MSPPRTRAQAAALLASPDDVEAQFYEALQQADLEKLMAVWSDDEDIACIHPGGPRILDVVEKALGLPAEATRDSREVLEEFGNMSSPTVLFILDRLRRRDAPRPCVALGFGPGLAAEAALFV